MITYGDGANRRFLYEYDLKDHLGNNRVTFMGTSLGGAIDVAQTTNYYPFGLVMNQGGNTKPTNQKNKYLYNGKELQDDKMTSESMNLYDYGARFYDPQIGRWTTIDPLCELGRKFTPYNYAFNNPLRFIDPDGKWAQACKDLWSAWGDDSGSSQSSSSTSTTSASAQTQQNDADGGDKKDNNSTSQKDKVNKAGAGAYAEGLLTAEALKELTALYGAGFVITLAKVSGLATIAVICTGDTRQDLPPKQLRIALGVSQLLADFSIKVDALPFGQWGVYTPTVTTTEAYRAAIITLGRLDNVTFHFNLSTVNKGLITSPWNQKIYKDSYTMIEFQTVSTFFPQKTFYYVKSGSIYKPVNP